MERQFPIKPGQPIGMALATVCFSSEFLIRAKNRFVKNGTTNFGRNIPTEISGPPPEVIPNIPVWRNRNGLFHLNSNRNFRNLWHNGKHPRKLKLSMIQKRAPRAPFPNPSPHRRNSAFPNFFILVDIFYLIAKTPPYLALLDVTWFWSISVWNKESFQSRWKYLPFVLKQGLGAVSRKHFGPSKPFPFSVNQCLRLKRCTRLKTLLWREPLFLCA